MSDLVKIVPAELHLEAVQGDTFRLSIDFGFDLTGYTIAAAVVPKTGSSVAMTIANRNDAAGTLDLVLPVSETAALALAYHSWYCVLTPAGGDTRTFFHGRFIVKKR